MEDFYGDFDECQQKWSDMINNAGNGNNPEKIVKKYE